MLRPTFRSLITIRRLQSMNITTTIRTGWMRWPRWVGCKSIMWRFPVEERRLRSVFLPATTIRPVRSLPRSLTVSRLVWPWIILWATASRLWRTLTWRIRITRRTIVICWILLTAKCRTCLFTSRMLMVTIPQITTTCCRQLLPRSVRMATNTVWWIPWLWHTRPRMKRHCIGCSPSSNCTITFWGWMIPKCN